MLPVRQYLPLEPGGIQPVTEKTLIHRFRLLGVNILLDVNSGAVHMLDDLAWDVLDVYDGNNGATVRKALAGKYPPDEVETVLKELADLERQGLLFSPEIQPVLSETTVPVVKALCLHVAHDCNLACRYCFAGNGPFGGARGLMTAEVGHRAVDFLLAHSGERRYAEIDFFGGEPLLNRDVIRAIVAYGEEQGAKRGKTIRFTLTTNAVLLDDSTIDYLNAHDISVVLSLDGRSFVHDRMRPDCGGRGSYHRVVPNIRRLVESRGGKGYYVRGTFTRANLDFAADVMHLADLGFREISVEPVVASGGDYALTEDDLPRVFWEYERLAEMYLARWAEGRPFSFFHFNLETDGGPCVAKRLAGCGAGYEYFAVTPEGALYPCHQFVGRDGYKMGDVFNGIENGELVREFHRAHIFNKRACAGCWARYYCSGGCHANAQLFTGSIYEPYALGCALQKKRLECALAIKARLALMSKSC